MASALGKIDRTQQTPFLLKLFYRAGAYHRLEEFSPNSDLPPFIQIYTWPTCSLRELSHLLTTALPTLLPDPAIGTRLAFRLIYADTRSSGAGGGPGRYMAKEMGSIVIGDGGPGVLPDEEEAAIVADGDMAGSLGGEPEKTLQDVRFVVGDYVSCAILPVQANGSVCASSIWSCERGRVLEQGEGIMVLGAGEELWDRGKTEGVTEVEEVLGVVLVKEWELECPMESGEEVKEYQKGRLLGGGGVMAAEADLEAGEVVGGKRNVTLCLCTLSWR